MSYRENRMVRVLRDDPRGRIHEMHCPWLDGPRAHPDWSKYETVPAMTLPRERGHCSWCAEGARS